MTRIARLLLIIVWASSAASAQSAAVAEQRTIRYFESIRRQPSLQLAFLREMPKGGDLHNHLSGALYAENLIDYAASDNLCVDRTTALLIAPPCDDSCEKFTSKPLIRCAFGDHVLDNSIVDAWSMRNWEPGEESGHDHFFATFDSSRWPTHNHTGDALAEEASRAAEDHLEYVELMHTADAVQSGQLGAKLGWDDDFARMREKLLANGLKDIVATTSKRLDDDESKMRVPAQMRHFRSESSMQSEDSLSLPGTARTPSRDGFRTDSLRLRTVAGGPALCGSESGHAGRLVRARSPTISSCT